MKKIILLLSVLAITNGCTQSTSLIGPSYTLAKSGSVLQAGNSIVASYGVKKTLNQAGSESVINSLVDGQPRECQTFHSSELSEVFFNTLDEIDCYSDPFSILR